MAQIPKALFGNSASGATLTIKAYTLMKEENDLTTACAIGIILLIIIIGINALSKWITGRMLRRQEEKENTYGTDKIQVFRKRLKPVLLGTLKH